MPGLYTPVTIKKVRQNLDVKRDFLTGLFFEKSSKSLTPTIILEYTKAGEAVAPFLTPMEAGRPVYSRTKKSNVINAPILMKTAGQNRQIRFDCKSSYLPFYF